MSAQTAGETPTFPVSARERTVSGWGKMVSVFQFLPMSKGCGRKSNKRREFACTFSKIMPSEHMRRRDCSGSIYI